MDKSGKTILRLRLRVREFEDAMKAILETAYSNDERLQGDNWRNVIAGIVNPFLDRKWSEKP